MEKIKKYSAKKFLNKDGFHSIASIGIQVEDEFYLTGDIIISDCSRTVTLSLDFSNEEELENNLFKVNTLIDELTNFKRYLLNNDMVFKQIIKHNKEKDKKDGVVK